MSGLLADRSVHIPDVAEYAMKATELLLEELCKTDEQPKPENP
jgi:hypothetical protein